MISTLLTVLGVCLALCALAIVPYAYTGWAIYNFVKERRELKAILAEIRAAGYDLDDGGKVVPARKDPEGLPDEGRGAYLLPPE